MEWALITINFIWQDWILRLNEENGLLKRNLESTNAASNSPRNESFKTSTNSPNGVKVSIFIQIYFNLTL